METAVFHTHPSAEISIPPGLSPEGERSWSWIEFGLHLPSFLLRIAVDEGDGAEFERSILTADIRAVTHALEDKETQLLRVDLLSPGYLNGSDGHALDRLAEIWADSDKNSNNLKFILYDERVFHFHISENTKLNTEFKLIASFRET